MAKLSEVFGGRPSLADDALDKYEAGGPDYPSPTGVEATIGGGPVAPGGVGAASSSSGGNGTFFGSLGDWASLGHGPDSDSSALSITVDSETEAAASERDEVSVGTASDEAHACTAPSSGSATPPTEDGRLADERNSATVDEVRAATEFACMDVGETIGVGSFSRVKIAVVRPNPHDDEGARACAIKVCHKTRIVEADEVLSIMREKEALELVRHPFVMQLYGTHTDEDRVYFVCEYIPGGELFGYVHNVCGGSMAEMDAQFYAACLADVFEHAHGLGVLNRDAKPENIVIDAYGYPKLCDWGFAKTNVRRGDRCRTICGTLEYLSREVLLNLGYAFDVDLWTLGVLLFELVAGRTPFFDPLMAENLQQQSIYNNILHGDVVPSEWEMPQIVTELLERRVENRLGYRGGAAKVKAHPFFADIDFSALRNRELVAPWTPMLSSETDITHFQDLDFDDDEDVDLVYQGDQDVFASF